VASLGGTLGRVREAWRTSPTAAWSKIQRGTRLRLRAYFGLESGGPKPT
jgi:hypothetical protein